MSAPSVADFLKRLKNLDEYYARARDTAAGKGKVLRYIASFVDGKARVSLQAIGQNHPCYSLSGSDIMIALTTVNCRDHPIVIKGPGAGAENTATGVLADIIRISHHQS
jgi:aspartokinase/homoserine dehydrogenase 1